MMNALYFKALPGYLHPNFFKLRTLLLRIWEYALGKLQLWNVPEKGGAQRKYALGKLAL